MKKIYRELAVDVMELVFVLAIRLFQVLLIHFLKIVEIVRTSGIDTFMDDEVLTVLFVGKGVAAVGAAQGILPGKAVVIGRKIGVTDLALDLSGFAVITVKVGLWRIAGGAAAVLRDVTFPAA